MARENAFFDSDDIALVQRVYKSILGCDWFHRTPQHEGDLARFIAQCFQKGMVEEDQLMAIATSAAKLNWSKAKDLMAWPIKTSLVDDV